jgi:hypothetical protein
MVIIKRKLQQESPASLRKDGCALTRRSVGECCSKSPKLQAPSAVQYMLGGAVKQEAIEAPVLNNCRHASKPKVITNIHETAGTQYAIFYMFINTSVEIFFFDPIRLVNQKRRQHKA